MLRCASYGLTADETATKLMRSTTTVKCHRTNVLIEAPREQYHSRGRARLRGRHLRAAARGGSVRRAITGAAILVGVFVIAPFVGAAVLGFALVNTAAMLPSAWSPRNSAWLTRFASIRPRGAWRSLVSAPVWGTGGPEFESRRPDRRAPAARGFLLRQRPSPTRRMRRLSRRFWRSVRKLLVSGGRRCCWIEPVPPLGSADFAIRARLCLEVTSRCRACRASGRGS